MNKPPEGNLHEWTFVLLTMETKTKEELLELRSSLPFSLTTDGGVYFLFLEDEIVYVEKSSNVISRVKQHMIEQTKIFDAYVKISIENEDLRGAMEFYYIYLFKPKYNLQLDCGNKSTQILLNMLFKEKTGVFINENLVVEDRKQTMKEF